MGPNAFTWVYMGPHGFNLGPGPEPGISFAVVDPSVLRAYLFSPVDPSLSGACLFEKSLSILLQNHSDMCIYI